MLIIHPTGSTGGSGRDDARRGGERGNVRQGTAYQGTACLGTAHRFTYGGGPSRDSGFTLLELMIVVIIITVAAGLCLPSFYSTINNAKKHGVASQFEDVCLLARNRAVFKQEPVELAFDMEKGRYWIRKTEEKDHYRSESNEDREALTVLPTGYSIEKFELAESRTSRRYGEQVLHFDPDGTAEEAIVVFKREETERLRPIIIVFKIQHATGHVTWKEYDRDDSEYNEYT